MKIAAAPTARTPMSTAGSAIRSSVFSATRLPLIIARGVKTPVGYAICGDRLAVEHLHELPDGVGAIVEVGEFVFPEIQLHYLLDAVLTLQVGGAGKHPLLVEKDGVHHLRSGRGRRVEGATTLEETDDLSSA